MKRFALVLLLALVPLLAGAQSLVIPVYEETPGGTRKWVGQTQPLPVTDVGASTGGASTTAAITALAAQQASESLANLAAIATITNDIGSISSDIGRVETTLKPISTPTRTEMVSDTVVAAITPTAGRIWIKVQNKSSTEEVTLDFVDTVTPGNGDTIYPGSHILLPVDDSVPIYVISSSAAPISILEATR